MKSTGAQTSNELQRLDYMIGYQDSDPENVCQVTLSFYSNFDFHELI